MSQRVGSARSSYGNTKAGDQHNGQEVSTQAYYNHSSGWDVLICTVPGANDLIAQAMEHACANNDIGYDQSTRNTLRTNVQPYGFDPSRTTKKVNTDCSALVRVCVEYAFAKMGVSCSVANFTTSDEKKTLLATGKFKQLTGKYEKDGVYLPRGAILVTKKKGHTVVVIDKGSKCDVVIDDAAASESTGDLVVTGDTVNVRYGPGTEYASVATVKKGTRLRHVDASGWMPVNFNGSVRWISGKYVKEENS